MADPITIQKIAADQDTDFEALYQEGIALLQQFSGDIWTDYNEHDPGVTILESLCYVLTDLYDRTSIPIQDLLNEKNGKPAYEKNAMYGAADILLNSATTPTDYRKIIIDQVTQVNNVWVNPMYCKADPERIIGIAGQYEVLVDLQESPSADFPLPGSANTNNDIIQEIRDLLIANRKMSESFATITILDQAPTAVYFDLYVKESVDAEQVLAEILFSIRHFLKPGVDFYTYEELAASGYPTEKIFEGPQLQNGFIPDATLHDKVSTLFVDSLLKLIVQTKDVASADGLSVLVDNEPSPAVYPIPKNRSLTLDLMKSLGNIRIYKRGVLFPYNKNHVISLVRDLESKKRKDRNFKFSSQNTTIEAPVGQYRDPSVYYSLQHEFPRVYGIGSNRLPGSTKNSRKAQALQLKAYLLFYEQLFADFMMQTANLSNLFSITPQESTYFYQPVYNVPDAPPLLKGFKGTPHEIYDSSKGHTYLAHCNELVNDLQNPYLEGLGDIHKKTDDFLQRRNAFLDHLLARFNYEVNIHPVLSSENDSMSEVELANTIDIKESLLQNMVDLTASRGNFNPTNTGINAGSKHVIGNLLHTLSGIKYGDPTQNILGNYQLLKPVSGSTHGALFRQEENGTIEIDIAHPEFSSALTTGIFSQSYSIEKYQGEDFLILDTGASKTRVCKLTETDSENSAPILSKLESDFFFIYLQYENIFIVDHIRLLPDLSLNKFTWKERNATTATLVAPTNYQGVLDQIGQVITDAETKPNLEAKPDPVIGISGDGRQFIHQDFYSARISVIIPKTAIDSIDNPSYSNYFHTLTVNTLPAHICMQIFWLETEEYKNFLELYALYLAEQPQGAERLTAFLLTQVPYKNFLTS